jgi:hypothetical protein
MRMLTSRQRTMAPFAVWFLVLLVFLLVWFMFGPGNRSWTTAIDAGVIAVATFLTLKRWPSTPSNGKPRTQP